MGREESDVIVDCEKCDKKYICCRSLRVKLDDDEVEKYKVQKALWDRKHVAIVAMENGVCYYFDPRKKKCKIWDDRPRMCRSYDCHKDERVYHILARDMIPPIMEDNQRFKVYVSVIAVEESDERKMSPMMLYSDVGPMSAETFEVRGNGKRLLNDSKKLLERMIREQLGGTLGEDDQI